MPEAPAFLTKFTSGLASTDFSFDLGRKEFLDRLTSQGVAKSREQAAILFEQHEEGIASIVYTERWAIQYNVYTDRVYFDRLTPVEYLGRVAEHHNLSLPLRLTQNLRRLTPRQYELFVKSLLEGLPGYREVRVTAPGADGGVDFRALRQSEEMARPVMIIGQAKHWASRVSAPYIQQLMGAMLEASKVGNVEGMFIALSGFTGPARALADRSPLPMTTLSTVELVEEMIANGVGITSTEILCRTPNPTFWGELNEL